MFKPVCIYCHPKREFRSLKEINYHVELNHPGQEYIDKSYYYPLFNTIFVTLLFIIIEIATNFLTMNPIMSAVLIIESGLFPVVYTVFAHKEFRERYSCPKCGSLVFPRIGKDNAEYWVCANDSCDLHDVKMNFLTWQD